MKPIIKMLSATALGMMALSFSASSQAQVVAPPTGGQVQITVDENGNGTSAGLGQPAVNLVSGQRQDPGPGGLANVLFYNLPAGFVPVPGDVLLQDLVNDQLLTLDVIRFNVAPVGVAAVAVVPSSIFFYSDNLDGLDNIGDTSGPPGSFYPNSVTLRETGIEGIGDGAFYTPTANQPGFIPGFAVTYLFVSDSLRLPEPSTWAMMLAGFGAMGVALRRRRRKVLALA